MGHILDFTKKETILVVDDTPDNVSLMSGLLKDLYKVKAANNGEKALKIARSESPPDLILLDIMMPGLSGYDVCKELKADPATCDIPIIFLTAMTSIEDEKRGLDMGAIGPFGERYSEQVKVYQMGENDHIASLEICGGPHVDRTGQLAEDGKKFKISVETASSAGIRRIKAILV